MGRTKQGAVSVEAAAIEESVAARQMWVNILVKWKFTGRLCGSVPLSKELIDPWLGSRMPKEKPDNAKSMEEIKAEIEETITATEERITLGFQQDATGLFVRADTIRAHLKDCANQVRVFSGISGFKAKVTQRLYIDPVIPSAKGDYQPVYLYRNGVNITQADGEFERPVHATDSRGFPINALKRVQYVNSPEISFVLRLLNDGVITVANLRTIMEYGMVHGYGGERSMQEGKYNWDMQTPQDVVRA